MSQLDDTKPELNIELKRVVCEVHLRCHLDLKTIALNVSNVEYRNENNKNELIIQLRKPEVTATVTSEGKISCRSAVSEEEARSGARCVARIIQKKGFDVQLRQMRVVEVEAKCTFPFQIMVHALVPFVIKVFYDGELEQYAIYKLPDLEATLSIYPSGAVEVVAPTVEVAHKAIEHIYPLVEPFRRKPSATVDA
ncbi:hypothetical protein V9T40_013961 [Parthenolecanium corni]|uniref:Uncharacterized protein n=1 Tax=Parthenolecanium corni TaxID=536013 RepID=A0AAN9TBV9_9HEMI